MHKPLSMCYLHVSGKQARGYGVGGGRGTGGIAPQRRYFAPNPPPPKKMGIETKKAII